MSKSVRVVLFTVLGVAAAAVLVVAGYAVGRNVLFSITGWPPAVGAMRPFGGGWSGPGADRWFGPGGMMGGGMMGFGFGGSRNGYGPGGMMGGWSGPRSDRGFGPGWMMGGGMMGFGASGLTAAEPLTIEQAQSAVQDYLASIGDDNLVLGEIMIFDNHAYAQILEADTGFGAMEVLVDPVTLAVYPEHGPNMMWNQKYGMMRWMHGGAWGGLGATAAPDAMPVTVEEAVAEAQAYLDSALPGTTVDASEHPFYGYYTFDILRDGEPIGMLSVHGTTGQVFPHTWHGDFVEEAEAG